MMVMTLLLLLPLLYVFSLCLCEPSAFVQRYLLARRSISILLQYNSGFKTM